MIYRWYHWLFLFVCANIGNWVAYATIRDNYEKFVEVSIHDLFLFGMIIGFRWLLGAKYEEQHDRL